MRNILLFALCALFCPFAVSAQTISGGDLPSLAPIKKQVYDTAQLKVYYEYKIRKDTVKKDNFTYGQTVLLVGDSYTCFMDNQAYLRDSINDACCREGKSPMEYMGKVLGLTYPVYEYILLTDIAGGTVSVQFNNPDLKVQYSQPMPRLEWKLAAGDSVISGVKCKKAVCRFGGRDWTAWFSPEYGLPLGPYMFNGLPGLVFYVSDDRHDHTFTLNGLEHSNGVVPVYLRADTDIVKLSRDKARNSISKYFEDSLPYFLLKYPGTILPNDMKNKKWSHFYNPIELE